MNNWLDSSNNANKIKQTYIQGFIDLSGGDLIVRTGNTYCENRLSVKNATTLSGNTSIYYLNVLTDTSMNGNLTVQNKTTLSGNTSIYYLNVLTDTSLNGNLMVQGNTSINQTLKVIKDASFNANVNIYHLNVLEDSSMNGNLTVKQKATFSGNVYINYLNVLTDTSLNGNLFVAVSKTLYTSAIDTCNNTIDIGAKPYSKTINLGGNSDIITIGGNISNTINYVSVSNGNIILNGNSATNNCIGAGIQIRNNGNTNAGYIRVASDMSGFLFKVPTSNTVVELNLDKLFIGSTYISDNTAYPTNTDNPIKSILTIQPGLVDASSSIVAANDIGDFLLRNNVLSSTVNQVISTTLQVLNNVSFNANLIVGNSINPTDSTGKTTGAFVVSGGVGITGNIYCGNLFASGNVYIPGNNNNTVSATNASSGALNVGVDGIYNGGNTYCAGNIIIFGTGSIAASSTSTSGALNVGTNGIYNSGPLYNKGNVTIGNTTASTSKTTGALIVSGGIGCAQVNGLPIGLGGNSVSTNMAIGSDALVNNTSGNYNIAIGSEVLKLNNTGKENVAIGFGALLNNTEHNNTAIGINALSANTTGNYNVGIGAEAGRTPTSSIGAPNNTGCTFLGAFTNTGGNNSFGYSTALGYGAKIDASYQIVLGTVTEFVSIPSTTASTSKTTGALIVSGGIGCAQVNGLPIGLGGNSVSTNMAIGSDALVNNTSGNYNIAIGSEALNQNRGGHQNVAIGTRALNKNTNINNTAVGYDALNQNISGTENVAIGVNAGNKSDALPGGNNNIGCTFLGNYTNTGGNNSFGYSTALGYGATIDASYQIVLGTVNETVIVPNNLTVSGKINNLKIRKISNNIAIGDTALRIITGNLYNIAIGDTALFSAVDGSFNTAIGAGALEESGLESNADSYNTAVGAKALYKSNSSGYNTAIGYGAGCANLTPNTGASNVSSCTFVGALTQTLNTTGPYSYSTALGYGATINANHQIVLGTSNEIVIIPNSLNFTNPTAANRNIYLPGYFYLQDVSGTTNHLQCYQSDNLTIYDNNCTSGEYRWHVNNSTGTQVRPLALSSVSATVSVPMIILDSVGNHKTSFEQNTNGNFMINLQSPESLVLYQNGVTMFSINTTGCVIPVWFKSTFTNNATTTSDGSITTLGGISCAQDIFCGGKITCDTPVSPNDNNTTVATTAFVTTAISHIAAFSYSSRLPITNTTNATTTSDGSISTSGGISCVNDIFCGGKVTAVSFNATSDYRLKTNIEPLNYTFTIDNLKPVSYNLIKTNKQDVGFLAHEVQEHFPFLVTGEKDGADTQSINYNGFIGILVKEMQDSKKEMQDSKKEMQDLKKEIVDLKTRLAILEMK